ncbi:hypothetical protein [Vibrio breoganii]|uniref:hypothetical protein n=1 Tax=Vibrio breoganii TaxID=553239 RepID=UPI0012E9AC1A|nr:hypothetical protein [Vibrio breoganii]
MTENEREAFEHGKKCFYLGYSSHYNPHRNYEDRDAEFSAWLQGWNAGRDDYNVNAKGA